MKKLISSIFMILVACCCLFGEMEYADDNDNSKETEIFDIRFGYDDESIGMTLFESDGINFLMFGDSYKSEMVVLVFNPETELKESKKLAFECKQLVTKYKYKSDYDKNQVTETIIKKMTAGRKTVEDYMEFPVFGYCRLTLCATPSTEELLPLMQLVLGLVNMSEDEVEELTEDLEAMNEDLQKAVSEYVDALENLDDLSDYLDSLDYIQ